MIKDYLERFEILDGCSVIRINDLERKKEKWNTKQQAQSFQTLRKG